MRTFDHIVIGAGSAGAVVAARLSEDPRCSVLLVEAGGTSKTIWHASPAAYSMQYLSKADWAYETEPEPGCDGRRIYEPRGKVLGGCSSMNASIWVRGNPRDYDAWAIDGWGWDDVRPVFERVEQRHAGVAPAGGANDGPMHVTVRPGRNELTDDFVTATAQATGVPPGLDRSSEVPTVGPTQQTVYRGRRWSVARGYLDAAAKRPNLTVLTRTLVHRIVLRDGRAVGIEYERFGRRGAAAARGDVILSAGAFNTPHLLQLSGIGDPEHLQSIGVQPRVANEHVGEHLAEHPCLLLNWERRPGPDTGYLNAGSPLSILRWAVRRDGVLATTAVHATAHLQSRDGLAGVDVQLNMTPALAGFADFGVPLEQDAAAVCLAPAYWAPKSEGRVWARSSNPHEKPAVLLNLLEEREDLEAMVRSVHLARAIAATAPFADHLGQELTPGPHVQTDADLKQWIRANCEHQFHPTSTARMSEDPTAGVVDPSLRVHGIDGLRVADCSVFPRIPRANTSAPAIMVGERCAAMVQNGTPAQAARA